MLRSGKLLVARIALLAVGVAFELASRFSDEVQREIADWREGLIFSMGVLPTGPYMTVQKQGNRIKYLGLGMSTPDVAILFKNIDNALMMFLGLIGTPVAASEKRFIIRGNISESMKIARTLAIVQTHLFPRIVTRRTFRRLPPPSLNHLWAKTKITIALVPNLLSKATKTV